MPSDAQSVIRRGTTDRDETKRNPLDGNKDMRKELDRMEVMRQTTGREYRDRIISHAKLTRISRSKAFVKAAQSENKKLEKASDRKECKDSSTTNEHHNRGFRDSTRQKKFLGKSWQKIFNSHIKPSRPQSRTLVVP